MISNGILYPKPLSAETKLLIETVTTRFEGVGAAFVSFDRGDHIELRCPERITMTAQRLEKLKSARRVSYGKTVSEAAPESVVRISDGAGAVNG